MSILRFNDGVNIDTSGPYRVIRLRDGYYVVGNGTCCPVETYEEGRELIKDFESGV